MSNASTIKATYVGGGSFLYGVPARDLTEEEWLRHKAIIQSSASASALYEVVNAAKRKEEEVKNA